MFQYITSKITSLLPLALSVIILVSIFNRLIPGDAVDRILGEYATETEKEDMRSKLGFKQNIATQILSYTRNIFKGNLGNSLIYNRPVLKLILERLQATVELALLSVIFALLLGTFAGTIAATTKFSSLKDLILVLTVGATAIPNFLLASIIIWLLAIKFEFFPVSGRGSLTTYILPTLTLGLSLTSIISRISYHSISENINTNFYITAKAKGLTRWKIIIKHIFKNAAISIMTITSLQFGTLVTGAIITERIFDWPGLGSLIVEALGNRDDPLIKGCILFFASSYLIVNILTDLFYAYIDPRIRFKIS